MRINGIIWLSDIVEKIEAKHHVERREVREVLDKRPVFKYVEKGHIRGENVYAAL